MSKNSDQIICAYCRKSHSNEKDVFLEIIRKELPNYQNVIIRVTMPMTNKRKQAVSNSGSESESDDEEMVRPHFRKLSLQEIEFIKRKTYKTTIETTRGLDAEDILHAVDILKSVADNLDNKFESQIYTDSGIDTAATHTLVSDESNLEKPDQNAPIQKAASSLVVESLPEENMADLLKKSEFVFHKKEQIKNQRAKQFSAAVSGTPWHVVWTQDGNNFKLFFYNLSSKTSVWQRPSELYNRKDVDLLVSQPPVGKFMTMPNDLPRMDFHVENLEEEIPLAPFVQPLHIVAKPSKPTNAPTDVLFPHQPRSKPTPEERRAERQSKKEYYHGIGQAKERYQNRMARKNGWNPDQHFAFK